MPLEDTYAPETGETQNETTESLQKLKASVTATENKWLTPQINSFIESIKDKIERNANGLYEKLGLNPEKIGITPRTFLEQVIRREQSYYNTNDKLQDLAASITPNAVRGYVVQGDDSIGPMQINLDTYKKCLTGTLPPDDELIKTLQDPESAIPAAIEVLKSLIPAPQAEIKIVLNLKDGQGLQVYTLPKQEEYIFKSAKSGTVSYTHDELRLLTAVGLYQGSGLRLASKDVDAPVDKVTKQITDTKDLILNNEISFTIGVN